MEKDEILEITISLRMTAAVSDSEAIGWAARSIELVIDSQEGLANLIRRGQAQRLSSGVQMRVGGARHLRRAMRRIYSPRSIEVPPGHSIEIETRHKRGCALRVRQGAPACTCGADKPQ